MSNQFLGIQAQCIKILLRNLNCSNALDILKLSELVGLAELSKHAFIYILHNFDNIIAGESRFLFGELSEELFTRIINHDHLNCENEISILHIINQWINEQKSTQISESKIVQLLFCVRFQSLNGDALLDATTIPFIQGSPFIQKLLSTIALKLKDHGNMSEDHLQQPEKFVDDKAKLDNNGENQNLLEKVSNSPENEDLEKSEKRSFPCCCFVSHNKCKRKRSLEFQTTRGEFNVPPEIFRLAREFLAVPCRSLPFVPCVVAHVRLPDLKNGSYFILFKK